MTGDCVRQQASAARRGYAVDGLIRPGHPAVIASRYALAAVFVTAISGVCNSDTGAGRTRSAENRPFRRAFAADVGNVDAIV
jgi:hypothetical protein